jgi:hypothetical protein
VALASCSLWVWLAFTALPFWCFRLIGSGGGGHIVFITQALEDWESWSGLHASGLVSEAHQLAHQVGSVIPELPTLAVGESCSDMEADGRITHQSDGKSPQSIGGEKVLAFWFKSDDFGFSILVGFQLHH